MTAIDKTFKPTPVDHATAVRRLTARWNEQCKRFPTLRRDIPLEMYLASNVANVMEHGLLESYDHNKEIPT